MPCAAAATYRALTHHTRCRPPALRQVLAFYEEPYWRNGLPANESVTFAIDPYAFTTAVDRKIDSVCESSGEWAWGCAHVARHGCELTALLLAPTALFQGQQPTLCATNAADDVSPPGGPGVLASFLWSDDALALLAEVGRCCMQCRWQQQQRQCMHMWWPAHSQAMHASHPMPLRTPSHPFAPLRTPSHPMPLVCNTLRCCCSPALQGTEAIREYVLTAWAYYLDSPEVKTKAINFQAVNWPVEQAGCGAGWLGQGAACSAGVQPSVGVVAATHMPSPWWQPAFLRSLTWCPTLQYIGGAFTMFMAPGVWTGYGPALTAPVDRIHW